MRDRAVWVNNDFFLGWLPFLFRPVSFVCSCSFTCTEGFQILGVGSFSFRLRTWRQE